ncbi:MAG TPA: VOC family protein [Jatrophihabitans sp.]|nr:VOC family protein [Jatrophihabitans sp.]
MRPANLDALVAAARAGGYDPGGPRPMSRRTLGGELLEWRLTTPDVALGDGLIPFLIDWGATPHPTSRALPRTPLLEWRAGHPDPESIGAILTALGAELPVARSDRATLTAVVQGAAGPVSL